MPGKVVILVPGAGGLDCPLTITAPAMQPRFGNALLVTDVNGDGKKDLLVGAPPRGRTCTWARSPRAAPPAPAKEFKHPSLTDTQALGDFGFRVGAVDIDGMPGLEVLVSAPDLPVGGELGAGPGVRLQAGRHRLSRSPSTTTRRRPTPPSASPSRASASPRPPAAAPTARCCWWAPTARCSPSSASPAAPPTPAASSERGGGLCPLSDPIPGWGRPRHLRGGPGSADEIGHV